MNEMSKLLLKVIKGLFAKQYIPKVPVSENGPQFTSHIYQAFIKDQDVRHVSNSPVQPKFNGEVERTCRLSNVFKRSVKFQKGPLPYPTNPRTATTDNSIPSPAEIFTARKLEKTLTLPYQANGLHQ